MIKRTLTAILTAFFLLAVFAGCNSEPNDPPDTTPPTITSVSASKTTLQLPDETSVTLSGVAESADGSAVKAYQWSVVDKPEGADPAIVDPALASTSVTGMTTAGTYKFQLKVTGSNDVEKTSDVVIVTVNAAANIPPTANAGTAQNVQLSENLVVTLDGCQSSDTDGTIASYAWSLKSKPAGADDPVIQNGSTAEPTVNGFNKAGDYEFGLVVTDNEGLASAQSTVTITVTNAAQPSVGIDGSANLTRTLAADLEIPLSASVTEGGWSIDSIEWKTKTKPAGAAEPSIADGDTANAAVSGIKKAGTYVFEIEIVDRGGAVKTAEVTVEVEAMVVTKDVTVTFPPFDVEPTVIDLNPIYTPDGGWVGFSANDIKVVLNDNRPANDTYWSDKRDIDLTRDLPLYDIAWPWPSPLFTQIFYDNDNNKLGEYSFYAGDLDSVGYFEWIYDVNAEMLLSLPPNPLILQLSKTVEELE